MKPKESVRRLGDLAISIGDGIEFAQEGDVVECISRKESSSPKTTARLTIGKQYEVKDIRFYVRADKKTAWGYISVVADNGLFRNYPLYRFKFPKGIERSVKESVLICEYCARRRYVSPGITLRSCDCARSRLGELPTRSVQMRAAFDPGIGVYKITMWDAEGFKIETNLSYEFVESYGQSQTQKYLLDFFLDKKRRKIKEMEKDLMGYVAPRFPRLPERPFSKSDTFRREVLGYWVDEAVDSKGASLTPEFFENIRARLRIANVLTASTPEKTNQKGLEPTKEPLIPKPGQRKINL